MHVEALAPTKKALSDGVRCIEKALADVLAAHGVAPPAPPPPPEPERIIVPPSATPATPPVAWGQTVTPVVSASAGGNDVAGQDCRICMAEVVADVRFEPCGHYACPQCVVDLRKRALFLTTAGVPCPYCRTIITRYDAPEGVHVGQQAR